MHAGVEAHPLAAAVDLAPPARGTAATMTGEPPPHPPSRSPLYVCHPLSRMLVIPFTHTIPTPLHACISHVDIILSVTCWAGTRKRPFPRYRVWCGDPLRMRVCRCVDVVGLAASVGSNDSDSRRPETFATTTQVAHPTHRCHYTSSPQALPKLHVFARNTHRHKLHKSTGYPF